MEQKSGWGRWQKRKKKRMKNEMAVYSDRGISNDDSSELYRQISRYAHS